MYFYDRTSRLPDDEADGNGASLPHSHIGKNASAVKNSELTTRIYLQPTGASARLILRPQLIYGQEMLRDTWWHILVSIQSSHRHGHLS